MRKNTYTLFFLLFLIENTQILQASDICWKKAFLTCYTCTTTSVGCTLDLLFAPGQGFMAAKLNDSDSRRREEKMAEFKNTQCGRCCLLGCTACAVGSCAVACNACGCASIAATAATASKICALGAIITPQIPCKIPMPITVEFSTGNPKN